MRLTVPQPVRIVASGAVALHSTSPLPGTVGVSLARRLERGSIGLAQLVRGAEYVACRFRRVQEARNLLYTPETSALLRSWAMHGGDAGADWFLRERKAASDAGVLPPAPLLSVFTLQPEDIYKRFNLGAWRFEYGLTPAKAARFVEDYAEATGRQLDYRRAFGDAAPAVINAVYRRTVGMSPIQAAYHAMLRRGYGQGMDSALRNGWRTQEDGLGDFRWPDVVAYFAVASEQPGFLNDLHQRMPPIPDDGDGVGRTSRWPAPVRAILSRFHPSGALYDRYASVAPPVMALLRKVVDGERVSWAEADAVLARIAAYQREKTVDAGFGSYRILAEFVAAGDWFSLHASIPLDSEMRVAFLRFAQYLDRMMPFTQRK